MLTPSQRCHPSAVLVYLTGKFFVLAYLSGKIFALPRLKSQPPNPRPPIPSHQRPRLIPRSSQRVNRQQPTHPSLNPHLVKTTVIARTEFVRIRNMENGIRFAVPAERASAIAFGLTAQISWLGKHVVAMKCAEAVCAPRMYAEKILKMPMRTARTTQIARTGFVRMWIFPAGIGCVAQVEKKSTLAGWRIARANQQETGAGVTPCVRVMCA
mmetsp:Transcript_29219/g.54154  ORF Transcript_29219/g.54154 Transcript_29219/m.54154 type:complete len:212 (-) Transcript_29219:576-1211(-)